MKESPRPGRPESFPSRVMGKSANVVSWLIGIGLFVPMVVLGPVPQTLGLVALAAVGFVAILFPWRLGNARSGICCGLIYVACVCLIAILQLLPDVPRWVPGYHAALSALVMGWVLLKIRYRGHKEILLFSSFEILLIGSSLFIPVVLTPSFGLEEGVRRTMITVCLESISILMALKIMIRSRPNRYAVIIGGFLFALAIISATGLLSPHPVVPPRSVHAFADSAALPASSRNSTP